MSDDKRISWEEIAEIPRPISSNRSIKVWKITIRLKSNGKKDRVFFYYYDNHTCARAEELANEQHLPGLLKRYPSYHHASTTGKALTGQALLDYIENEMGQMKLL